MKALTKRQHEILIYAEECLRENNPPSQREFAEHFGLTQNAAYQLVRFSHLLCGEKPIENRFN